MGKPFGDLQIGDRIYVVCIGEYMRTIKTYELFTLSKFLGFVNIKDEQDVLVLCSPNWMDEELRTANDTTVIFTDEDKARYELLKHNITL